MRPFDPRPLDYQATPITQFLAMQGSTQATHAISIVDPGDDHPNSKPGVACLHFAMHDLDRPDDGSLTGNPSAEHVAALLDFAQSFAPGDRVVIHCTAGRRRSTAMAVIADIAHRLRQGATPGPALVDEAWAYLLARKPDADPNRALIALGDDALGLGGLLVEKRRNMVRYINPLTADY